MDEITEWFDAAAARYPDLDYIDVVNEALPGHNPAPFKNALGGDGASGYDWIVKAFIMARERWPKAVLIYNDFNTFMWNTDAYIDLLKKIKAAGAPVDVAGCQAHDLGDIYIFFRPVLCACKQYAIRDSIKILPNCGKGPAVFQLQKLPEHLPHQVFH